MDIDDCGVGRGSLHNCTAISTICFAPNEYSLHNLVGIICSYCITLAISKAKPFDQRVKLLYDPDFSNTCWVMSCTCWRCRYSYFSESGKPRAVANEIFQRYGRQPWKFSIAEPSISCCALLDEFLIIQPFVPHMSTRNQINAVLSWISFLK